MSFIEVERGKSYYCEVALDQLAKVVEGATIEQPPIAIGGIFSIDGTDIRLRLVHFDEHFHVSDEAPLKVRTEANWTASLFDTISEGAGHIMCADRVAFSQNVLVNTALIGWDAWTADDRVRRTQFRVFEVELFLRHWPTFKGLLDSQFGKASNQEAFDVPVAGGCVRVQYNASGNTQSHYPRDVWAVVEMEFDEGISLSAMRNRSITMLRFLSAVASTHLQAREQIVSRLTRNEWLTAVKAREHPLDYSVYYYEGDKKNTSPGGRRGPHCAFAHLYDDTERNAFIACLQVWFSRNADWEGAASAMMSTFALHDEMSPERLLNATKWIEATPGTKPQPAMSEDHILALCKLVSRNAEKLGYGVIAGRLRNSLRQIANEQNAQRFARLVSELKTFYGDQVVGDDLAEWVAEAFSWRGRAAHRPMIGYTEVEYKRLFKAIQAAECFAYLMLIRDLPMSDTGRKRVASAELVERYCVGIKGQRPRDIM
jgi:hypothetical protein